MRWSCPHCHTQLAIPDDQLALAWSFSLCPSCSRFGLIRKSFQLAVKVDRAPPGEQFLRATLAGAVTSTVAGTLAMTAPLIKPAQPRRRETTDPALLAPKAVAPTPAPAQFHSPTSEKKTLLIRLPEPLPEIPATRRSFFPRLIMFGALGLLAWNGIRYLKLTQNTEVTDHVVSNAMAPVQIDVGSQVQSSALNIEIHNGPGIQYPVIGTMVPHKKYAVISTEEQWYQVQAGTKSPAWVLSEQITPAN